MLPRPTALAGPIHDPYVSGVGARVHDSGHPPRAADGGRDGLGALVVLILLPILEIAVLIQLGGWIGLWPTLGVVLAAGLVGVVLLRASGQGTLSAMRVAMAQGRDPGPSLLRGGILMVAGVLFICPGLLTDAVALALLLPPVRQALANRVVPRRAAAANPDIIEGTWSEATDAPPNPRPSGWVRDPAD